MNDTSGTRYMIHMPRVVGTEQEQKAVVEYAYDVQPAG